MQMTFFLLIIYKVIQIIDITALTIKIILNMCHNADTHIKKVLWVSGLRDVLEMDNAYSCLKGK